MRTFRTARLPNRSRPTLDLRARRVVSVGCFFARHEVSEDGGWKGVHEFSQLDLHTVITGRRGGECHYEEQQQGWWRRQCHY